jgi:hypothetical protein
MTACTLGHTARILGVCDPEMNHLIDPFGHLTFYLVFLLALFQISLAPAVVAAESEVFVLVFAAELAPALVVAEPEVFALLFVAEPSRETHYLAAEPEVVFVSEPRVSVDIVVAFAVLVPVYVVVVEVDSPGHPRFLAFPSVDWYPSSSSSVEVVG